MLKKLLGLNGKSEGFYLVLNDDGSNQKNTNKTAVATKPAQKTKTATASSTAPKAEPKKTAEPKQKSSTAKKKTKAAPVAQETVKKTEPAVPVAQKPETKSDTPEPVAQETATPTEPIVEKLVYTASAISDQSLAISEKYRNGFADNQPVELTRTASKENLELVIEAAYKQVFGNAHLMESERLPIIESELRDGQITVSEFVRRLAQSERYRALFFDKYPNSTAIELNFKHLLGRAPENYAEISKHIQILAEGGFAAEIDSYIDSEEYWQNFGEYTVPYYRGYDSQIAKNVVSFTHSFQILPGACSSDKSTFKDAVSKLQNSLIQNSPSKITALRTIPDSFPESLILAPPKPPKTIPDVEELIANAVGITYWGIPAVVPDKTPAAKKEVVSTAESVTETVTESEPQPQETITAQTFATDYLIAKPAPNRRPGASLNKFREMTRKMKVRV
ncbi:MAG: phycobilisome rod-core linker polypeptide [Xenococcus sp. MO_188.B8]|nr:phycobilisome rod-core linker polypeptide [Xenococcus sp. MO_188.B8]